MRIKPKTTQIKPETGFSQSKKSLKRVIFSVIWLQRRWLISISLIFVVFFTLDSYGASPTKDAAEKPRLFKEKQEQLVTEAVTQESLNQQTKSFAEGILGGPSVLGALIAPVAQADVNLEADDELEDQDLLLIQENSLVSNNNPSGTIGFPGFSREIQYYVVRPGDAAEKIAASFNINSDTLLAANGLTESSIIKPGQQLLVLPINGVRVKVGAKDTVETLAKKYSGDKMEIIAFNNLPLEGTLKANDFIIIPDGEMPPLPKAAPRYAVPANKYAVSSIPAGWLIIPTSGHDWGRIHASNGVDIANVCGTPVYAAASGKVILSDGVGYNGGYGKYIKIQHTNGVVTLYGHSSKLLVDAGQQVSQGQLIMLMGTTGRSTGCHLHFEVRGASNPLAGKARNY